MEGESGYRTGCIVNACDYSGCESRLPVVDDRMGSTDGSATAYHPSIHPLQTEMTRHQSLQRVQSKYSQQMTFRV